jgi:hypothetical protein
VFCAVMAAMAEVPKTPNWWNVFKSAWIPAPPPESDPAIVSATFINEKCAAGIRGAPSCLPFSKRGVLREFPPNGSKSYLSPLGAGSDLNRFTNEL